MFQVIFSLKSAAFTTENKTPVQYSVYCEGHRTEVAYKKQGTKYNILDANMREMWQN